MDLRKTFHGILRDYGHDVLFERRLPDVYDSPYPTPQYDTKLERHTTRHVHGRSLSLAMNTAENFEGLTTSVDIVYYFKWDVNPQEGDRIYEPDPRYPLGFTQWTIDYAHPMRGRNGSLIYWVAGVTRTYPE